MASGFLAVACFCLTIPLAAGLNCYECEGYRDDGERGNCIDAEVANIPSNGCGNPASGQTMKCALHSGEGRVLDINNEIVARRCESVAADTPDSCIESSDSSFFTGLSGITDYTGKLCYCSGQNCNGQITLAPTIFTSLIGLTLAICAVL